MVEKVVCVPEWVTEKRTITTTEYTQETRTKTVTCYKRVAETKEITEEVMRDGPRNPHEDRHLHGLQAGL